MLTTNQTSQDAITAVAANFLYILLFLFGLLRRTLAVPSITGLISDLVLLLPVVLVALYMNGGFEVAITNHKLWYLLPLLGIISTAAMSLTMVASQKLPVSLFGTLCYLEPVFLFITFVTVLQTCSVKGAKITLLSSTVVSCLIQNVAPYLRDYG